MAEIDPLDLYGCLYCNLQYTSFFFPTVLRVGTGEKKKKKKKITFTIIKNILYVICMGSYKKANINYRTGYRTYIQSPPSLVDRRNKTQGKSQGLSYTLCFLSHDPSNETRTNLIVIRMSTVHVRPINFSYEYCHSDGKVQQCYFKKKKKRRTVF